LLKSLLNNILRKILTVPENTDNNLGNPGKILIIRQHNQFGDLLASVSFFRAIKEKYPGSKITLIVSPDNYYAVTKNKFIDSYFIFDKGKLFNPVYFLKLYKILRAGYDLAIVPVTVSISFTSNILARLSDSKSRIGVKELNGRKNEYDFFFDRKGIMDWRKHPDSNVSEFCLELLQPYGITTSNFKSEIAFDENDLSAARRFIEEINTDKEYFLVGLHVGAGKPPNRWSLDKYKELIERLNSLYKIKFYITGSDTDSGEINYLLSKINIPVKLLLNRTIPEVAAIISQSCLFITNDTGIMHVAGTTDTPQISIFGPTNPFNWAPIGKDKYFIRKSELIDDITVDDVFNICREIISKKIKSPSFVKG
jgi:ADP-heptose:LPS heptosyltransferase